MSTTSIMNQLPMDTVNIILEFSGYHKNRNGRFMRQIAKHDERYQMIKQIPPVLKYMYDNHRYYIMLHVRDQRWLILTREIYYEYIIHSLTEKRYPAILTKKQSMLVQNHGYGCSRGYGNVMVA